MEQSKHPGNPQSEKTHPETAHSKNITSENTHSGGLPPADDTSGVRPPRILAWETTAACNLACKHCRGSSTLNSATGELTTDEAKKMLRDIRETGTPIIILSGGEPLMRPDIFEIARYGTDLGFRMTLATNGTMITQEIAQKIREAGIQRVSISLDGRERTHDTFRCIPGCFSDSMRGIQNLNSAGVEFQINTTVSRFNVEELEDVHAFTKEIGAAAHHFFFLVPTGRGAELSEFEISPEEYETALLWLYGISKKTTLQIRPTCAPHYFRILRQKAKEEGVEVTPKTHGLDAMTKGCLGGISFGFISSIGDVNPCGYLPVLAGNVRKTPFKEIWENAKVFNDLRNYAAYKGKCGDCGYKTVCGGCRARAYHETNDYMEEEPLCSYVPPGYALKQARKTGK
ncbi:heme b synthase [Methanolapillus ohkumae]|uniref:Mycofactocin radical SAM maturase MftC n=1 Tax=Methanolapillus ohkumae TaxID=3028298 RepID=A0AA96V6H1_9EURY|nr:Putative mycofactocin radical SAM maturase MftC [Methanosarcinaceae archaeon Am2]